MEIEKGTFEDIVRKMMANLDGQHQPELAGTSGTTRPACGKFTDSMAASALAAALSEHGFTINEGSPEDGQVLGDEDFKDIEEDLRREEARIYRITHTYDIGNQDVYVEHPTGDVDGKRVALYCWFKASEWFGSAAIVSNLGIAAAMVSLYGFRHCATRHFCTTVDLYADAEGYPDYQSLMADASLHREGLRHALAPHLDGVRPECTIENAAVLDSAQYREMPDEMLTAQDLVQQGAVHAVSFLLQHGCNKATANQMLESLRANAGHIREEAARRGKALFKQDQVASLEN